MPTLHEIDQCKEIVARIDKHIPLRGYAKEVQELMKKEGKEVPTRHKVQNVRHGKSYDLDVALALEQISTPRDEDGNIIPISEFKKSFKKKPQTHRQASMFAEGVK